jgi:hypothetical protein
MKNGPILILTVGLAVSSAVLLAQDADQTPKPPRAGSDRGPGGPGGQRPPPSPLFEALDLNHDGVIDADELAKASESLKKLDKNGDGKLTPDELRPARRGPNGPPPGGDDQAGPQPPRRPRPTTE